MNKKTKVNEVKRKEEIAQKWKEYYECIQSIYPLRTFEIEGENGEILIFHHGSSPKAPNEQETLYYSLIDKEYSEYLEELMKLRLQGEDLPENDKKEYKAKGFISINRNEKYFSFAINKDYKGHGYDTIIYENYRNILEMLGIEDKEQYDVKIFGNPKAENVNQILLSFSKSTDPIKLDKLNNIIAYAINLNIPISEIANAINKNEFNVKYSTNNGIPYFKKYDFERFKSFGIKGLRASCMHNHFIRNRNFSFMKFLDEVDKDDATLEFRRIYEAIKEEHQRMKNEGTEIPDNLEKFGELEYIILDWEYCGLLFKNVIPEIKEIIKKQAISVFDKFDPEHMEEWSYHMDRNSTQTLKMLRDAGLMDKNAYIELYQKALSRGYNLKKFDYVARKFIDDEERRAALEEINQNPYFPPEISQKTQELAGNLLERAFIDLEDPDSGER